MTVSSEITVSGPYDGNGVTVTFPYAFKIVDQAHIRVVLRDEFGESSDLSLGGGDYTVSGVGNDAGGSVTLSTAPATGEKLTLLRNPPLTQETDLANQGAYYPEVVEARLDLLTMQIQKVNEATTRTFQVPPGEEAPSLEFIQSAADNAAAAAQSASDASTAKTLAMLFANAAEDTEVLPGLFSAKHWMLKTQAIYNAVVAGFAAAIHAATAKTSFVDADELGFWDSVSGALRKITLANFWAQSKWRSRFIGEVVYANTAVTGVDTPPSTTTDTVWIELTAGLTGAGAFNNGKVTSETVSGSVPLVSASVVINYGASPINGQTVRLLNTEGRILRPSASPGTLQDDQFQDHAHSFLGSSGAGGVIKMIDNTSGAASPDNKTQGANQAGTAGTPRSGSETRMKNIGVKAYMRIA